jgi:hypothetical protein
LNNLAGLTVDDLCTLIILAQNPAAGRAEVHIRGGDSITRSDTNFFMESGATVRVIGAGRADLDGLQLENDGGNFAVENFATLKLSSKKPADASATPFIQHKGITQIWYDCVLEVSRDGFWARGGTIETVGNPHADQPGANLTEAKIKGKVALDGASVVFSGPHWRLWIEGDVTWSAGSYIPRVDVGNPGVADIVVVVGQLTVPQGSSAAIKTRVSNYDPRAGIAPDRVWHFLTAAGGATVAGGSVPVSPWNPTEDPPLTYEERPTPGGTEVKWFLKGRFGG